jgi:asparagine synthetase B (glutamine-hydrolysing)
MCGIFGSVGFTDGFTTGLMTLAGAIEHRCCFWSDNGRFTGAGVRFTGMIFGKTGMLSNL